MRFPVSVLLASLMLGSAALANMAPPPDLPNTQAAEAVQAFMENFNAGNIEGIESVLADRTDFLWPENGVLRNEGEAATVADIKAALVKQVVSSVLWEDCMRSAVAAGATEFWELGPGGVLAGLAKRTDRNWIVKSYAEFADLAG